MGARNVRHGIDFEMTRKQADHVRLDRVEKLIELYSDKKAIPEHKVDLGLFFSVSDQCRVERNIPALVSPSEARNICGSLECLAGEIVVQFGGSNLRLATSVANNLIKITPSRRKVSIKFWQEADRLLGTDLHDMVDGWSEKVSSILDLFASARMESTMSNRAEILLRLRDLKRRVLIGRKLPKVVKSKPVGLKAGR